MTCQKGNKQFIEVIVNLVKLARQKSDSIDKDVLGNATQT